MPQIDTTFYMPSYSRDNLTWEKTRYLNRAMVEEFQCLNFPVLNVNCPPPKYANHANIPFLSPPPME